MTEMRQITRDRLADVQAILLDWIGSARYAPGDRIPTERELARILLQPRHVVRSAIMALTARGLLVRQVGRGTHVAAADQASAATVAAIAPPSGEEVTLAGILEARLLFEPALVRLAAARASGADLDRLQACARAIGEARTIAELECAEADFTAAIAATADNPLLTGMMGLLAASWSSHGKARGAHIAAPSERREAVRATALELVAALGALDADRAAEISRSSLLARLRQFSGYAAADTPRPTASIVGAEGGIP